MWGDWALPGLNTSYLDLAKMVRWLPGRKPSTIPLDEICVKPGDWFGHDEFSDERFERADTRFPGIIVHDMPNPCNLPYRMVDGRRRYEKLRRDRQREGIFFVFSFTEIQPFVMEAIVASPSAQPR